MSGGRAVSCMTMSRTSSNFCKNAARLGCRGLDGTSAMVVTAVVTGGEGERRDGGKIEDVVDAVVDGAAVAAGLSIPMWG